MRLRLLIVVVLSMGAVSGALGATPAGAAKTCPGSFQVLNNDRIGSLKLPAGPYVITTSGGLGCGSAATLLNRFLEDWDGVLPNRWKVSGSGFRQGTSTVGFTLAPYSKQPPVTPSNAAGPICPVTFSLTGPDGILGLAFRAGNYSVQLLTASASFSCAAAYREFSNFLNGSPSTPLPRPWTLSATSSTFSRSSTIGFHVLFLGGSTGGGGRTVGYVCPGSFQVVHGARINSFRIPAGRYYLYAIGDIGCAEVVNRFRSFLAAGRLPSANWSLNTQIAQFLYQGNRGFRVEPVGGV